MGGGVAWLLAEDEGMLADLIKRDLRDNILGNLSVVAASICLAAPAEDGRTPEMDVLL